MRHAQRATFYPRPRAHRPRHASDPRRRLARPAVASTLAPLAVQPGWHWHCSASRLLTRCWLSEHAETWEKVTDRMEPGHILTGPIYVEGAKQGDVLRIDIEEVKLRSNWVRFS